MRQVYNLNLQKEVVSLKVAEGFWERFKGLLSAKKDQEIPALWFPRCSSVHMIGMKFPLDILFLDAHLRVIKIHLNVSPMRLFVYHERASSVLEIINGRWDPTLISVGDQLIFR